MQYAVRRIFTSGYVKSSWLELAIDLLRQVEHPRLRASFPTTKRVLTHRLTIGTLDQLDDSVSSLIREAHETVGPGTGRDR